MCQSTTPVLEFTYNLKAKELVTTARTPVQDKLSRTKSKPMSYCDQYLHHYSCPTCSHDNWSTQMQNHPKSDSNLLWSAMQARYTFVDIAHRLVPHASRVLALQPQASAETCSQPLALLWPWHPTRLHRQKTQTKTKYSSRNWLARSSYFRIFLPSRASTILSHSNLTIYVKKIVAAIFPINWVHSMDGELHGPSCNSSKVGHWMLSSWCAKDGK